MTTEEPKPRPRKYTDEEIDALHAKVKELGAELQLVIEEIVRRAKLAVEANDDGSNDATGEALAALQALGSDDRRATG